MKLNQIYVCITEDESKEHHPLYVACNVKHLRIDEFTSLRYDTIKPKLFANERPGTQILRTVSDSDRRISFDFVTTR